MTKSRCYHPGDKTNMININFYKENNAYFLWFLVIAPPHIPLTLERGLKGKESKIFMDEHLILGDH